MFFLLIFVTAVGVSAFAESGPDELVICQGADILSLDPLMHQAVTDTNYSYKVFETLCNRDANDVVGPLLAVSHKQINDTTWEFKLRKGVRFHNGSPFTAKDVKFSYDRYLDPANKFFWGRLFRSIQEVKVIDDSTVQIITKFQDPLMLKMASQFLMILPADQIKEKGAEAFFQHPVGTGLYKFVSWTRNDRLVLQANEGYWGKAPRIKRLIIRAVPEASARVAELQSGNADIITSVPPFLVQKLKDAPNVTVQSVPSWRIMHCYLNTLAPGPMQNKKVRQAVNYAVDKKGIIDNVLKGSGTQIATILSPYYPGFDASLKPYPYDPAKAKQLLAEAGYAKGLKVTLNTCSGRYQLDKEVAEAVAGMLTAVGVQVDFNVVEWATYLQMIAAKKLKDIGLMGWGATLYDPDSTMQGLVTANAPSSYYSTPKLTEKVNQARSTMDEKKRVALYKEIQKEIFEEAPFIFLYSPIDNYGVSRKVKGFQARGDELVVVDQVVK
jgi:peptide/nickel transport system substrate-binding protein